MNVVEVHQTVKLSLTVAAHEYVGQQDHCRFRNGNGEEIWKKEEQRQIYSGQFLRDCIHNYGAYIWQNIDLKQHHTYEGKFFANNLEGYGVFSYPDGQTFEGLFKNNSRFGPGVLTHSDATQDVGLWLGNSLVRLSQTLKNEIPNIAETIRGKAYLLNYKELVKVQQKREEPAVQILKALNASENVLGRSDELYSKFVRNSRSVFFNRKMYENNYFNNDEDWTIDVVDSYDSNNIPVITKVLVTHLLAWNNEKLAIKFMQHAFRHRNLENILSYNVSKTFSGQRQVFKPPGRQETLCLQFLQACCDENDQIIIKYISNHNLYPDVSDFRGNNGVIFAAVNDRCKIIKTLTNYGANIDHMNDECLTSLIICILRFTVCKFEVTNWELAFLPSVEPKEFEPDTQTWRTYTLKRDVKIHDEQTYIFDLSCKKPVGAKKEKQVKPIKNKRPTIIIIDDKQIFLDKILSTIICLLNCGSKPNYGECPFPPLILSIFARSFEIVDNLLQHGADINIRTSYHIGSLTPLHIVTSLAPSPELVPMARVLLTNGANPNLFANKIHWEYESEVILAGTTWESEGKTPLQLLCMRYDFIDDENNYLGLLCTLLISLGADPNAQYLGHIPLTLALLRGNIQLMKCILDTGSVDPNQCLGNNMGVPLTVLILKRYENVLPGNVCEKIYDILLDFYANPLNDMPNFPGNAVEFCLAENKKDSLVNTGKANKKNKEKAKKTKVTGHELIIGLLSEAALTTLLKRIYKKVVQYIYQYHIECRFENPIFEAIVKYINLNISEKYLQMLIDHDLIFPSQTFCLELLEYVDSLVKKKSQKTNKKIKIRTTEDMVDDLDFDKTIVREKQFIFELFCPELDPDESKFKVCFECFQKQDKTLIRCPVCQMVYFCSQECNLKNYKRKTSKHPCKILFYKDELQRLLERQLRGELFEEDSLFDQFYSQREQMIASDPNYFENLRLYDQEMTKIRDEMKERLRQLQADKESKSSRKGRKDLEDGSKVTGSRKKDTGRSGPASTRSGKDKSGKIKDGKESKGSKGATVGKGRKGAKEGQGGKGAKEGKGGKGAKEGKGGKDGKGGKSGKSGKGDKSGDKTGKGGKIGGKSGDKIGGKGGKGDAGDGKGKDQRGLAGRKPSLFPDLRSSKASLPGHEGREEEGGQDKEHLLHITDGFRDAVSDICNMYDERYFYMFMPYCVCVDGQLYYKFDNCMTYLQMTYSNL